MTSRVLITSVLVAADHDQGGRDAISLAKQLRAGEGALTLAHVYVEEPIVYRGVSAQYYASQRQDDLERMRQASEQTGVRAQLRWHLDAVLMRVLCSATIPAATSTGPRVRWRSRPSATVSG